MNYLIDPQIIDSFRARLLDASVRTSRDQFNQEPHYTSAFFGNLNRVTFTSASGQYLKIICSASNDRGPNSAESKTGVDIGIVVKWEDPQEGNIFEKAILLQAKNNLERLGQSEILKLGNQCLMMQGYTHSYGVMDCPYDGSIPKIGRSNTSPPFWKQPLVSLDEYLIDTVFECEDGDSRGNVIDLAKKADRTIKIATNSPWPGNNSKLRKKPRI
jgi:hypothetical protein